MALEVLVALLEAAGLLSVALEVLVALLEVAELLSVALEVLVALLEVVGLLSVCLLYTSPSPRDRQKSRMPSSA